MYARTKLLKFMILGQRHQRHLEARQKCKFLSSIHPRPTVSDRMSQAGAQGICVLNKLSSEKGVVTILREKSEPRPRLKEVRVLGSRKPIGFIGASPWQGQIIEPRPLMRFKFHYIHF